MPILQKWAVLRKGWDEAVLTAVARPEGGLTMAKLPDVDEWAREAGKKGAQYALELLEQEYGVSAARLRELAQADREGRCVVLPAKTVFELTWDAGPECDGVCPVCIHGEGQCDSCDNGKLFVYERPCKQEHIERLGKDVFLTRAEAEAALRREQNG